MQLRLFYGLLHKSNCLERRNPEIMLDIIRKNAASWLMKFILGAIVVVFIFWGVGTFRSQRLDIMAKVNGQKILVEDYQKAYNNTVERLRRMYGGSLPEAVMKQMNLKQQVLDQLIDTALIDQAADKMGILVTDKEVQQVILGVPAFKQNGVFNPRLYQAALRNAGMKPVDFEQNVRKEMYLRKVQALLTAGIFVPDSEAVLHYKYDNAEINVEFIKINSSDCVAAVNATEKRLKDWFQAHKEEFKTDPQVKLKYILFARKDVEKSVNATEQEIKEYFQEHPGEFHVPEMRKAAHILLKVPEDANATQVEAVRKRAEEIEKKIKAGEPFGELAKIYSQDPGSAKNGGNLGFFRKGQMVKPFDEKVFSMKEGQVSEPVRTRFGFHIIKLEKIKPERDKSLNEVKGIIARKIKEKKIEKMLWDQANKAYDTIIELGSLESYAESANKTIEQTGFFSRKRPAPLLGFNPQVLGSIFSLSRGELSSLLEVPGGVMIAELADKKPPYIPPFEEVKERVKDRYISDQSLELCRKRAEEVLKAAREKGLAQAAKLFSLKIEETGFFKRTDSSAKGKLPAPVIKDALSLYKSKPFPEKVSSSGRSFFVLHLKGVRENADMKAFDAKKDEIRNRVRKWKAQTAFTDWLKHQREKARIEIIRKP